MQTAKPLLLGLLVIALALGLFLFLAQLVAPPAETPDFDRAIADHFHEDASESPGAVAFFRVLTDIGDRLVMATFCVSVLLVLLWWRQWGLATAWVFVTAGAVLLNTACKDHWERARPATANLHSASFPSGHAMNSFSDFGMLAYLLFLGVRTRWLRKLVIAALGVLVLLIGFSRIYLTDHWLTDVLGGFCLGAVWLGGNVLVIELVRRRRVAMPEPVTQPLEKVA